MSVGIRFGRFVNVFFDIEIVAEFFGKLKLLSPIAEGLGRGLHGL